MNAPRAARPLSRTGRAASCSSRATPPPAATAEAGDDRGVDAAGACVCPVVHRAVGAAAGAGACAAAADALPPRVAASHGPLGDAFDYAEAGRSDRAGER